MNMPQSPLTLLRATIRQNTHKDEQQCVAALLQASSLSEEQRSEIVEQGRQLVTGCRADIDQAGTLDVFMQEFSLSSKEGVALMCLAESLLRVPDAETADQLIAEKILSGDWQDHLGQSDSLFVNASTWGLMLTGKIVSLDSAITEDTDGWIKKLVNRCGEPMIRTAVRQAMKIMGQQYVLGRDIGEAIKRGRKDNNTSTRFSFDMLGEGARTTADAKRYFDAYQQAIREIGQRETENCVEKANGISVKLSALHPRYQYSQKQRVMTELLLDVRQLAINAKHYGLGFSIDAEEADRLDLSLDIFEALARDQDLADWDGLGFVLQAYGKRAPWVTDWLITLAKDTGRRFMVRLVKGAYWDTEIKYAQEQGYADYPVYTRKANTDLSYQVCAGKLLHATSVIYPQFATHNAHTAALILALVKDFEIDSNAFEFQRLHGMGDLLHRQLAKGQALPVRVYAPVGAHKDLLPYLVRRLLENGANSSFVNRFMDKKVPVQQVINDVQDEVESNTDYRHSAIPLPENIYRAAGEPRPDTHGLDLADQETCEQLIKTVATVSNQRYTVGPIIGGEMQSHGGKPIVSPADNRLVLGHSRNTTAEEAQQALALADEAQPAWDALGAEARAKMFERTADLMQQKMQELVGLISYEAGRTLDDGISEVREAVDFLRYYALQARQTGNHLKGRGVFFCISPWNFPLAIFTGQIAAALAAGNSVLAKPADQTPMVAAEAIKLFYQAGVPADALHLIPGDGATLGKVLNVDPRIKGIAFTGSTEVANIIDKTLSEREGITTENAIPTLIAETGGQNVMLVDSSALLEQVVDDAIRSAFLSAGQRCSALRVLYIQEETADSLIEMLTGAMDELTLGKPWQLDTDIGPVIDQAARQKLQLYIDSMTEQGTLLHNCTLPEHTEDGTYIAPHLIEVDSIKQLPGEIFGPVLHLIRYKKSAIKKVIRDINETGYGLTLGVHSRVENFAVSIVKQTRVGNNYINRNMVGAVVGVNPFGGQGLSGTGPKAGGPHYLQKFADEKACAATPVNDAEAQATETVLAAFQTRPAVYTETLSKAYDIAARHQLSWDCLGGKKRSDIFLAVAQQLQQSSSYFFKTLANMTRRYALQAQQRCENPIVLPGPTGETNELSLHGRGIVFCSADKEMEADRFASHTVAALLMGNAVIVQAPEQHQAFVTQWVQTLLTAGVPPTIIHLVTATTEAPEAYPYMLNDTRTAVIAWAGEITAARKIQQKRAANSSAITPIVISDAGPDYLLRFAVEKTITTNSVATGGNALLLNLDEK